MSKLSFLDKLGVLFEVSKSSYLFIIAIVLLIILGIIFATTNMKNAKRNKKIYLSFTIFTVCFIIMVYHGSLSNIFDYMMDNFFIAIFFPNLAIYLAAIITTNIIVWISIFSFRTSEMIKRVNIIVFIIMNYLLALILSIINTDNLDVFKQSSIYGSTKATALVELSSIVFMIWIIFLIIYKIILVYILKDYKQKVKKVIVRKKVKMLPENFETVNIPDYVYGNISQKSKMKESLDYSKNNQIIIERNPEIIQSQGDFNSFDDRTLTKQFEDILTVEDYKLLLKMLKEQKNKEQEQKQEKEKEAKKINIINYNQIRVEKPQRNELTQKRIIEAAIAKREQLKIEESKRKEQEQKVLLASEITKQEQLKIEELKRKELEREQEKFTELEMLYRSMS